MHLRGVAVLVGLVLSAACGTDRSVDRPVGPVVAAVVRADSYIVPFAEYAGGQWRGPGGVLAAGARPDLADRDAPWFGDRLDALRRWQVMTPLSWTELKGDPLQAHATGEPVEVDSHCQRAWALPTDLAGTPTPEHTVHRNVGVAFSAGPAHLVAEILPPPDEVSMFLTFLRPLFDEAEAQELSGRAGAPGYAPRTIGAAHATVPLEVTKLYRAGRIGGVEVYTFEAVRTYGPSGGDTSGCREVTVMNGWLGEDAGHHFSLLRRDVAFSDCDRKGSPVVQPMAAIELDGRLYVLTVDQHYEGETYSIFEARPDSVSLALTVYGGGC